MGRMPCISVARRLARATTPATKSAKLPSWCALPIAIVRAFFVTLNTILHDSELEPARKLIRQLYDAGVDAMIVQDMGILELDLPPMQMHASTQCDIRTPEKSTLSGR